MVEYGLLVAHSAGTTMASVGDFAWWKALAALAVFVSFFMLPRGLVVGAVLGGLAGVVLTPTLSAQGLSGLPLPLLAAAFGGIFGYLVHSG